ncbi:MULTISPECIES: LacI family DNA-binding transcriptional regulator [Rhizobium/Agrobacterium group]|uniref:LacI family DNA-binding transcriptional regulator n=1 Tax=Rhizobium/Agrobacterium group TaxID=227290 RepID=UPI0008DBE9EE|nr:MULTISPECIES: LacI family DNA-binding transcriptional regulator [Rhizobium/Agrobacterium group]MCF1436778.1 LacI family transcriptional regulator [Allorhizobium ampelinum]MCF1464936.1 LacI family transcriptional regulator [Allorhizobium ampelinum]MCF1474942.1 LacI family transcriptional regulator [Allorhizobium ampelinum]MCF1495957.1 LacI family transcriptional regulator [Allorhizobium ampelinum]MUO92136.1 LacI family DNA-binding transcriptional regulator [Agrobacterium vitis]
MTTGEGSTKITIKEVAEAAGVSRSSVSNYLNERFANMGLETRERINQAIESLGYRPNNAARQLKTGKVPMVGLLVPTVINPFFGELALAVEQAAGRHNYRVLLCNTMRDAEREYEFEEEMLSFGIRGVITVSPIVGRRKSAPADLAVVAIDARRGDLGSANVDLVNLDNQAATSIAVDHLVSLGHRHIAYVSDSSFTFARASRAAGFEAAVAGHGLSACPVVVQSFVDGIASYSDVELFEIGRGSVAQLLSSNPRPTAIIALNDMIAVGILSALRQHGVAVPGEMSLVGIDDIVLSQLTTPGLSTIRQPVTQMAEAAVELLIARLRSPTRSSTETVFQPELVRRESTEKPFSHERI